MQSVQFHLNPKIRHLDLQFRTLVSNKFTLQTHLAHVFRTSPSNMMLFLVYFQTLIQSLLIFTFHVAYNKGCFSKETCLSSSWAVICHNKAEIQVWESWIWHTFLPQHYTKNAQGSCIPICSWLQTRCPVSSWVYCSSFSHM